MKYTALTLATLVVTPTQAAAPLECRTTLGPLESTVEVRDSRMNVTVNNTGRFTVIKPSWPTSLVTHRTQMRAYTEDGWQHTDLKPRWYLTQLHWVELGEGQVFSTGWLPMPWPEATHFVMDIVHGDYGDYRRSKSTCTPSTPVPALPTVGTLIGVLLLALMLMSTPHARRSRRPAWSARP